jgi:DNA-binding transcriptional MerR regulator
MMAKLTDSMTISEFASRTRLTQKALRLYDAQGLLQPAVVDERNGYRLYAPAQMERGRRVSMLRELGVPLVQIATMLELDNPAASEALRSYWARADADHRDRSSLANYLIHAWASGDRSAYLIATREVAETKVFVVGRRVAALELPTFIPDTTKRLYAQLAAQEVAPTGAPVVLYREPTDVETAGQVEVYVPFNGRVEPVADMAVRIEPARHEAYTTIPKEQVVFPTILQAYDAVMEWIATSGGTISDAPREVYFDPRPWPEMGAADPACDIAVPFTR